jgi:AraC-like DNA-binding protein
MAAVPRYLTHYPNMDTVLPFHMTINTLVKGFPSHRHDFLEFSYVIEGSGSEVINGVEHPMQPGTFTLVMPYQYHEIHPDPGARLSLYNCNFGIHLYAPGEALPGIDWQPAEESLPPFVQMAGGEQERMNHMLQEMMAEYTGDEPWRRALIKAKLTEVLVHFDRVRRVQRPQAVSSVTIVGKAHPRGSLWRVIQHIHSHYQDDLTLSGLAERFGFSVPYLSELFKKTVGQNFVTIVHDVRIRQACGLLVSTEMNVSDIALESGYGSYNTFARIFRETKGMTPVAYRKSNALKPLSLRI